jgi:hypothetical protein
VLLARHAKVHVGIDEGGQQVASGAFDDFRPGGHGGRAGCRKLGDLAADDDHVEGLIDALARIDDVCAADDEGGGLAVGLDHSHAGAGSCTGSPVRAPARTS